MAELARDELLATFKNLLASGEYSDLIITCGGDTHKVHKAVVCSRAGFFKRAERFPVGKESAEGKIDLPEDDPAVVNLLIQYLYEGEYDPKLPAQEPHALGSAPKLVVVEESGYHYKFPHTCELGCPDMDYMVCPHHECQTSTCGEQCVGFVCRECCLDDTLPAAPGDATQLLIHAQMYEIGDKYDVTGLKELSREKYARACAEHWDSETFAPAAYYAFSTTPENDKGLRDVVTQTISEHMSLLNKPAVEAVLNEFNGLAVGLLKMRAKELGWIKPSS